MTEVNKRDQMEVEIIGLNVRIHNIEELEYQAPPAQVDIKRNALAFGGALRIKTDKNLLFLQVETTYSLKNGELLSKLKVEFSFEIKQLQNIIEVVDENSIRFTIDIIPDLFRMSMDMMRGIYYEKLKNTALKEYIIPIVDTQKMLGAINKDQKEKAQEEKEG